MGRLVKRLGAMEASAAARARRRERPEGQAVVWVDHEVRVDASALGPGEFIAADLTFPELNVPHFRQGLESEEAARLKMQPMPPQEDPRAIGALIEVELRERVTLDSGDLGRVYDGTGAVVGRVVSIDPGLIVYEWPLGGLVHELPIDPSD